MISQTNDIDKVYNFLLHHFTYNDLIRFEGELDKARYCINYIEVFKLESYIKEEEIYPTSDDCFDRFGL